MNIVALRGLFGNEADANLFQTRVEAYEKAQYITQRRFMSEQASATASAELAALYAQLGIQPGENAFKELTTQLIDTMPEAAGPGRFNLLQQLGDFSKFEGWVHDVQARGLQPNEYVSSKLNKNMINPTPGQEIDGAVQGKPGIYA